VQGTIVDTASGNDVWSSVASRRVDAHVFAIVCKCSLGNVVGQLNYFAAACLEFKIGAGHRRVVRAIRIALEPPIVKLHLVERVHRDVVVLILNTRDISPEAKHARVPTRDVRTGYGAEDQRRNDAEHFSYLKTLKWELEWQNEDNSFRVKGMSVKQKKKKEKE
jgi:hypothetical protein